MKGLKHHFGLVKQIKALFWLMKQTKPCSVREQMWFCVTLYIYSVGQVIYTFFVCFLSVKREYQGKSYRNRFMEDIYIIPHEDAVIVGAM